MPHKQVLNHHKGAFTPDPKDDVCDDTRGRLLIRWKWLPEISPAWKTRLSWLFIMSVLAEASFLVIQVVKTFQTKSAEDLSLPAVIILLITNAIWGLMAIFVLRDYGVLISGVIYTICSSVLIVGILMYGENSSVDGGQFKEKK